MPSVDDSLPAMAVGMARFDLTDFESGMIQILLPNRPPNKPRGVARLDDRRVLNGIFRVLRTGSPWRDLPERYGPHATVHNVWAKAGVWVQVFETISEKSPDSMQFVDSSAIRARQHAAAGKMGARIMPLAILVAD